MGIVEDSNAVHCTFTRSKNTLIVEHKGERVVASTVPATNAKEEDEKGPTPLGLYLIDTRRIHPDHRIGWYNLHQKAPDGSFYGYGHVYGRLGQLLNPRRSNFGIHPGSVSFGCVTVSSNWDKVDSLLQKGSLTYDSKAKSGQKFVGYLNVVD
eukprot:Phypoly_transcript_25099.p1 GENE.Phypoly_transcript_25099~~Phypoly_transcript_25099.p1  ORF type:complete len:153 (+),score=16.71 Phypoly_transcript_25099:39-497(+)